MQNSNDFPAVASGGGGGGHPACASCKHQRKKCDQKCILAKYFPASKTEEFLAVQKCFGVSNVTKMIKNASEGDRKTIAESLIWEASCRQRNPVYGSYGEYAKVYNELKSLRLKLQAQNLQSLQQGGSPPVVVEQIPTTWNFNNDINNGMNRGGGGGGGGVVVNYDGGVACNYNNIQNGYDWSRLNSQYSSGQSKEEKESRGTLFPLLFAVPQQQQQQQQYSRAGFNPRYSPAS